MAKEQGQVNAALRDLEPQRRLVLECTSVYESDRTKQELLELGWVQVLDSGLKPLRQLERKLEPVLAGEALSLEVYSHGDEFSTRIRTFVPAWLVVALEDSTVAYMSADGQLGVTLSHLPVDVLSDTVATIGATFETRKSYVLDQLLSGSVVSYSLRAAAIRWVESEVAAREEELEKIAIEVSERVLNE